MNTSNDIDILIRLSEMVSFAEYLPLDMISMRNTEPVYPVAAGEYLVNFTLDIVLTHEWTSQEYEGIAGPLEDALSQLDTDVDQPEVWKDLFSANTELKKYLKSI